MKNQNIQKNQMLFNRLAGAYTIFVAVLISSAVCIAESDTAKANLEKLVKTKSCKGCDLSGLTMNRLDLVGVDLEGANLSGSKLSLTNLSRANLKNCNLRGAIFSGTDLSEADLRGADLRGTSLGSSYHQGAQFDGEFVASKPYEDLGESDVVKEVFVADPVKPKQSPETKEVKVSDELGIVKAQATIPPETIEQDAAAAKLKEGQKNLNPPKKATLAPAPAAKKVVPMQHAVVDIPSREEKSAEQPSASPVPAKEENKQSPHQSIGAKAPSTAKIVEKKSKKEQNAGMLTQKTAVDTTKAINLKRLLEKNKCYGCDLSGLDLSGKNLEGADLEKADLTGCNLEKADLEKANLKGALLTKANLRKAKLKNADFYRADLSGAIMTDAKVEGTMFDSAQIETAVGLKSLKGSVKK